MLNLPTKQISQQEFRQLIIKSIARDELRDTASINLRELLVSNGFAPSLKGIDLAMLDITVKHPLGVGKKVTHGLERLKKIDYSDLEFIDCSAQGCNFSGSVFNNVKIQNCNFSNAVMMDCEFQDVEISQSTFDDTLFTRSSFKNVSIQDSNFNYADFCGSSFDAQTRISNSYLDACSFIGSVDQGCQFSNTTLTDCVLPKDLTFFQKAPRTESVPPRPIVGILWEPHLPGHTGNKAYERIKQNNGIPVRVSYLSDGEIDLGKDGTGLDGEVKRVLSDYTKKSAERDPSILNKSRAMCIMEAGKDTDANPEVAKIRARARRYGEHLDAFIIPGGADIPSELYGQDPHPEAAPEDNYMRSVIEFAVIEDQKMRGNPQMGICRGCQIFNVYHGGYLTQRVADAGNFKSIDNITAISGKHGTIPALMDEGVRVMSVHHQAVEQVGDVLDPGDALEVVAVNNGIVKAVENKHGAPIILTQFHPEVYGEYFTEVFQSHKGSFMQKFVAAMQSASVQQLMTDKNHDFIAAMVQMASVKHQAKTELMKSIEQLNSSAPIEQGVDENSLIRPSSIKPKTNKSEKPGYVAWLGSLYEKERKQNEQNKSEGMFSVFYNRSTKRNERKLIESLSAIAKEIQDLERDTQKSGTNHASKISNLEKQIDANIKQFLRLNPSSMIKSILDRNESEELSTFELNRLKRFEPAKAFEDFANKNPDSFFHHALAHYKSQKSKAPTTVTEIIDALDLYEQHQNQPSQEAAGFLLVLGELHRKFYHDGSEILDEALVEPYPQQLLTYVQTHNGKLPASYDEWQSFKATLPIPTPDNLADIVIRMDAHMMQYKEAFKRQIDSFCTAFPQDALAILLNERQPDPEQYLLDKQKLSTFMQEYRNARKAKQLSEAEARMLVDIQLKREIELAQAQIPTQNVTVTPTPQVAAEQEVKPSATLFSIRTIQPPKSVPSSTAQPHPVLTSVTSPNPRATNSFTPSHTSARTSHEIVKPQTHLYQFLNDTKNLKKHHITAIEPKLDSTERLASAYSLEMNPPDLQKPFKLTVENTADPLQTEQESYLFKTDLSNIDDNDAKIKHICNLAIDMALPGQEFDLTQTPPDIKPQIERYLLDALQQAIREGKFKDENAPTITGAAPPRLRSDFRQT